MDPSQQPPTRVSDASGYPLQVNQVPYPQSPTSGASFIPPGAYVPTAAPAPVRKKPKLPLIIAAGVLILVLVIGVVVAVLRRPPAVTAYSTENLTTVTQSGITFAYPSAWKQIDASGTGMKLGYGNGSSPASRSAVLYYNSSPIRSSELGLSYFSDAVKKSVVAQAVSNTVVANTPENGCTGFNLDSNQSFTTYTYFGTDIRFSCTANAYGASTIELDRYIYTGDGNLYEVSIAGTTAAWQANQSVFEALNQKVSPK